MRTASIEQVQNYGDYCRAAKVLTTELDLDVDALLTVCRLSGRDEAVRVGCRRG